MIIYLMRHGKEEMPDQGLSEEGRQVIQRVALQLQQEGVKVEVIFHSIKKRSQDTAALIGQALQVTPTLNLAIQPGASPEAMVASIQGHTAVMIVGHLPSLHQAVLYLTGKDVGEIKPGFIAKIEDGSLVWFRNP